MLYWLLVKELVFLLHIKIFYIWKPRLIASRVELKNQIDCFFNKAENIVFIPFKFYAYVVDILKKLTGGICFWGGVKELVTVMLHESFSQIVKYLLMRKLVIRLKFCVKRNEKVSSWRFIADISFGKLDAWIWFWEDFNWSVVKKNVKAFREKYIFSNQLKRFIIVLRTRIYKFIAKFRFRKFSFIPFFFEFKFFIFKRLREKINVAILNSHRV